MNRVAKLLAIAVVLCLAVPAGAQQSPPADAQQGPPAAEDVLAAYKALVDHGRDRSFFGLPERVTWRVPGPIGIAFYADERRSAALRPALAAVAGGFGRATGRPIDIVLTRPLSALAGAEAARMATGSNLEIVVGPRPVMAQMAGAFGVGDWMLGRFEDGRWPFLFSFPRFEALIGRVMIADDEPREAQEAALILAVVWALGGITLGDQMEGLVDPMAPLPALTPLGEAVFALMYHPEMQGGEAIPDALARAQALLGQ
jgi:hypothetical protein